MTLPQYPVLPQELSKLRREKESAGTMDLLPQGSEEFKDTDLFIFRFFVYGTSAIQMQIASLKYFPIVWRSIVGWCWKRTLFVGHQSSVTADLFFFFQQMKKLRIKIV